MREILFRGRSMAQGSKWLYGDVLLYENSAQIWETIDGRKYNSVVSIKTIGQFTGLTDKNGTKIFEGDIVKAECDLYHGENKKERVTHIGTVIYDKKFCQFGINVAGFSKCHVLNRWKGDYNEVIGNIHDNPELLEEGEKT